MSGAVSGADQLFLRCAIELAEAGRLTCSPNPPVGCIIVRDGVVLGRGFHVRAGEGHAEVEAIRSAGGKIQGATVYVSLEPCAFVGRTPACAATLIEHEVARVVIAARDPHPQVDGAGVAMLEQAGIAVDVFELAEAKALVEGFVSRVTRSRPFVRLKSASSLDGATALASGASQWITSEEARRDAQYWRARADAIVTGVGTVLADDPQLTVRDPAYAGAKVPMRIVLDGSLRTPSTARVCCDDAAPTTVLHDVADAPEKIGNAETVRVDGGPQNLQGVLNWLAEAGCNEVLVEAGPKLLGSFVEAGLWDEWLAYVAPAVMGSQTLGLAELAINDMNAVVRGEIVEAHPIGPDLRLRVRPKVEDT